MVDIIDTRDPWERGQGTKRLTNKTPVAERDPWEHEKTVAEDIRNVAPSALRTGGELVPAGPAETSGLIPELARWLISHSPLLSDDEAKQTLADFDAAKNRVLHPSGFGGVDVNMDPRADFGLESVRQHITDPLLGPANPQQAETLPGKIVQRTLEIAPSVFTGPGGIAQKAMSSVLSGAGGPIAAALAERAGLGKTWQTAADIGGSLAGGVSPMIYNRIVNPNPIPATRQPAVDIMDARRVPLSVGQRTGNERILRKELMAGGPDAWTEQPAAFTRATAETQGGFPPETDVLPNATMRTELERMGAEFDRLEAAANPTPFDMATQNRLINTTIDYQRNNPLVAPVVEDIMNDLGTNAAQNGGFLTGQGFQSARSKIGELIRKTNDDGVRGALMDFQDALDNMLQGSLSPADQHAFRTVRAQYRNYLPIEFAKSGQGQVAREGFVTPQSLMTGIRNVEGRREVASGDRPMTQLAEAGGTTMVKPSSSGTGENLRDALAHLATLSGGGLGAMVAGLMHGLPPTVVGGVTALGAAAGGAIPRIKNAFVRSDLGQRIMSRDLAPRIDTDRALLSAILAAGAGQVAEYGDQTRR